MQTPIVSTQADPQPSPEAVANRISPQYSPQLDARKSRLAKQAILLIPDEINAALQINTLNSYIEPYGYLATERFPIFQNYDNDQKLLSRLTGVRSSIVVFIEAWMAPIYEHLAFLEKLAENLDDKAELAVCFIGRSTAQAVMEQPLEHDTLLWKDKISARCKNIVFLNFQAASE